MMGLDLFSTISILTHVAAILILLSTLPRQFKDILAETNVRYRKICWVILLGTISLMLTNSLQMLLPFFYGTSSEYFFNNLTSTFHATVGIMLGALAHMMYKSTKNTVPHTIDEIAHKDRDRK
jgi:hypothetical protein